MKQPTIVRFKAETDEYNKKVKQAKSTLQDFGLGGKQAGQAIGQLDKLLGTSIGTLGKLSMGIGAATVALKVAKDAFFNNEQQLDAWGKTVEASESLYKGFLNSLNTGDISGFLTNINSIVSAAKAAYDALDELATFNAFNQVNLAKTKAGLDESIADYREGTGSKEAVGAAAEKYKKELQTRQKLEQQAYDAAVKKFAAERGVNPTLFKKAMSGSYGDYASLKSLGLTGTENIYGTNMYGNKYIIEQRKVAANEQEKLGEVLRKFNDTELQELQALGAKAFQTSQEIAAVEKQTARVLKGSTTTTKTPTVKAPKELITRSSTLGLSGLGKENVSLPSAKVGNIFELPQSFKDYWFIRSAQDNQEKLNVMEAEEAAEHAKELQSNWLGVGSAIQSAANNLAQFASTSQEAATAAKAMTIAASIATLVGQFAAIPKGAEIWSWIAGTVAGTATLLSTIASIKSATAGSYANGGIIPGPDNGGRDNTWAYVSPGEVILNKSQQSNLAAQLTQQSQQQQQLVAQVSAEQISFILSNRRRRIGSERL